MLSRPNENLSDHLNRVKKNLEVLDKEKGITKVLNNIICELCKNEFSEEIIKNLKPFLYNLKTDTILWHDEGKKNPYFQSYIGNVEFAKFKFNNINKQHSIISAYYFLSYYKEKIDNTLEKLVNLTPREKRRICSILKDFVLSCAHVIYSHHGNLKILKSDDFCPKINSLHNHYANMFFYGFNKKNITYYTDGGSVEYKDGFLKFIFIKYLYSLLVTCDYLAVYEFNKNEAFSLNLIKEDKLNDFKNKFNNNKISNKIRQYESIKNTLSPIDKYRTEMFLESEKNLLRDNNMFYLESPTGSGKSITSINLSLLLMNNQFNKLYYVAPYINIITQVQSDIESYIGCMKEDVVMVNSKEEIIVKNDTFEDMDINYEKEYMNNLMLNYPVSVISHVRFFDILFGNNRKKSIMLTLIPNSVVVIDEIQSYKNSIWINIINLLKKYSDVLNIKVIIMSATLPKLEPLLLDDKEYRITNLITNKSYYYDFFRSRVTYDFSLLDKPLLDKKTSLNELYGKIDKVIKNTDKHRILIGLIKRSTCDEVYKEMQKYKEQGFEVYKIKGNTNIDKKQDIVNKLKDKDTEGGGNYTLKKVILVATQCIEAGVDIDMNIGFKNIAIPDADYQFCGRIERNFFNVGTVYFFKVDAPGKIYIDDYRAERNLSNKEWRELFINCNFDKIYEQNYKWLIKEKSNSYLKLKELIYSLDYFKVNQEMKLLEHDSKINLLLEFDYKDKSGNIYSCKKLQNEFNIIRKSNIMSYSERQIKLSKLQKSFDRFTYEVTIYDIDKMNLKNRYCNGNYLIIKNAIEFFEDTKDGYVVDESEFDYDKCISFISVK